jgi:small subunit ribosomal protein S16
MLKIRLQRIGKRGQAYFRVVVLEHTTKPKGKYLEFLGSYDPHKNELKIDRERIKYWLSKGAKLSETVNNLLVERKIIEGEKVKVWKPKSKKKKEEKSVPAVKTEKETVQEKTENSGCLGSDT